MLPNLPKQHNLFDLDYNSCIDAVTLTLLGFHTSKNYREAWNQALKLAKRHSSTKWLINLTHFRGSYNRDLEWSFGEWFEKASWDLKLAGANEDCRAAILLSDDMVTEYIIKSCLDSTQSLRKQDCITLFKNEREAKQYLL